MNVYVEMLEVAIAIIPAVLAVVFTLHKPQRIHSWVAWVVGASANAIVALGLLLKRLTASCSEPVPTCAAPQIISHRTPGIFSLCSECRDSPISTVASKLNQLTVPVQAAVALICVAASFYITIRFVIWAKKILTLPSTDTHR